MGIDLLDLPDCDWVLELGNSNLLDSQNDAVLAYNCNSGGSSANSLKGILNLEELAIRGEDCVRFIVAWHLVG